MKALVIGATGYVGSAIARNFKKRGYETYGLARSAQNRKDLEATGINAVDGSLENLAQVRSVVAQFDSIVLAATVSFDAEPEIVSAIVDGCRGAKRPKFIFTSGTGVLGIQSKDGRWSDYAFAEDDPFPFPAGYARTARLKTEAIVRDAAVEGLHAMVIRPPLIYGHAGSMQVPAIFGSVQKTGKACYVGHGLNLYSNVHVDDLAEAYALALEKGSAGALYHVVSGEANFRSIAEAVATVMRCEAQSLTHMQACEVWGDLFVDNGLAVNSRSVPRRTRQELGWEPRHLDVIEDIRNGSYRERYGAARS